MLCHRSWRTGRDWSPEWVSSPFSLYGLLSTFLVPCWLSQIDSPAVHRAGATLGIGTCQLPSQPGCSDSGRQKLSGDSRSWGLTGSAPCTSAFLSLRKASRETWV